MLAQTGEVKGQPRVIFFDAAGTLIRLTVPAGHVYAQTARDHGVDADPAQLEHAFRAVWQKMPPRPPSRGPRPDDDRPWWRTVACETLRRAAELPAGFDDEAWFADVYARFARPGMWELHDDVLPCLAAVRPKARLAVISNFDGRLRTILRNLGVADFFEHLFISSEVGAEKPSPEIFRQALATMDVDPSACLHVGDDEVRDGNGARQAGLAVFLVDRPGRSLQDVAKLCV